jgi:hypothetical protein
MGALAIIPSTGLPPARARLVDLNKRISAAEKRLATLQSGKAALSAELGRAAEAKLELQTIVDDDALKLVDRLRSGGQWLLSSFGGNSRARELSAALSESRIQAQVGEKALSSVGEEIAVLEREVADLRLQKPDATRAVLVEVAEGYRADVNAVADDLRQLLTILGGLDKITAKTPGDFIPDRDRRTVVTIPAVGGMGESVVVAPASAVERAQNIWLALSAALDKDALATIEHLKFPHVSGTEDSSTTVYADYSRAERHQIDLARAQGV